MNIRKFAELQIAMLHEWAVSFGESNIDLEEAEWEEQFNVWREDMMSDREVEESEEELTVPEQLSFEGWGGK